MRALLALLLALLAVPASAKDEKPEEFSVQTFTCPLTGKTFRQEVGYFAFPLITMPDGSWLGDTQIGVQIPVCPDDGLVLLPDLEKSDDSQLVYHQYSATERARLPALIADPEYSALKADGPYAQAYWLATQLGRPGEDRFFMLQRATWATSDPALRRKLVARLAADGEAVIATYKAGEGAKRFHLVYVASALRELGRFDEATALLDRIEAAGPPVLKPDDPDSIYGPGEFVPELRQAIADRDDGRFPAAMLPAKMVDDICEEKLKVIYGPTGAATKAACKARREREAKESRESEQAFAESADWKGRAVERDKACLATPVERRSRGLAMACEDAQRDRDQIAGLELAKQPEKLAADCLATPYAKRAGPLIYACDDFADAVGGQMGELLAQDDAGYALVCDTTGADPDVGPHDRTSEASDGCRWAKSRRKTAAVEALKADLPALDKRCAAYRDRYDDEVLVDACRERKWELQDQAAVALAGDQVAFDRACSRYRAKMRDGWITDSDDEFVCRTAWERRTGQSGFRSPAIPPPVAVLGSDEMAMAAEAKTPLLAATVPGSDAISDGFDIITRRLDETRANKPLQEVARRRAAEIIAQAKADGSYPKRQPGDREW